MSDALILIGWRPKLIDAFLKLDLELELVVFEEPSLQPTKGVEGVRFVEARYQQCDEAVEVALGLAQNYDILAVIPLREYATPAAQDVAKALGLPAIGHQASRCFRDKFVLRTTIGEVGAREFSQPAFTRVLCVEDALEFFDRYGESIIKPSNRQSTVGVFRLRDRAEVAPRFHQSMNIEEPGWVASDRSLTWHHQIEEFIDGQEYSTELFFRNRKVIFANSTRKRTHAGATPYEIGHTLPIALVDSELNTRLISAAQELARICNVNSGTIHAEWMVRDDEIFLIECAGRPPGCFITDMISHSYGFNYFGLLVSVLTPQNRLWDQTRHQPQIPNVVSAMRWFDPKPGRVIAVSSTPDTTCSDAADLITYSLTAEVGDIIDLANNHTRVGYAIADGQTAFAVEQLLDNVSQQAITTEMNDGCLE